MRTADPAVNGTTGVAAMLGSMLRELYNAGSLSKEAVQMVLATHYRIDPR